MPQIDMDLFAKFDAKISELSGNVIRRYTAKIIERFTICTENSISYQEAYNNHSIGIEMPSTRLETLQELENAFEGISNRIMNEFLETSNYAITALQRKSVFG